MQGLCAYGAVHLQRHVQTAHVHAQLQGVGGGQGAQGTAVEVRLHGPPVGRGVAGTVHLG